MPSSTLPSPSQIINCRDITSCFQAIYNFLFAIFVAFAFLSFLYGAILYLSSGAGIYDKDKGKSRMKNSIIALIIVLAIPIILNMIDPNIFKAKLQIPYITVIVPILGEGENANGSPYSDTPPEGFVRVADLGLPFVKGLNDAQVSRTIETNLQTLNFILATINMTAEITSGYSPAHQDTCHTTFGTCIDIRPAEMTTESPCVPWDNLGIALKSAGAKSITYETKTTSSVTSCVTVKEDECGIVWKQCPMTSGPHIHAEF
jgi:hypothetical protein